MIRVLFVCLGNICRSPLAEGVFIQTIKNNKKSHLFHVDSAGTASYHIGKLPDIRSRQVAEENGFKLTHRARAFTANDFNNFDYIVVMDKQNRMDVESKRPKNNTTPVLMMRGNNTNNTLEVPDPYYGNYSDFVNVYQLLSSACDELLEYILSYNQNKV